MHIRLELQSKRRATFPISLKHALHRLDLQLLVSPLEIGPVAHRLPDNIGQLEHSNPRFLDLGSPDHNGVVDGGSADLHMA